MFSKKLISPEEFYAQDREETSHLLKILTADRFIFLLCNLAKLLFQLSCFLRELDSINITGHDSLRKKWQDRVRQKEYSIPVHDEVEHGNQLHQSSQLLYQAESGHWNKGSTQKHINALLQINHGKR